MIRKEAKARWVYTCQPCGERQVAVDEFRAIEIGQHHEKTAAHAGTVLSSAVNVLFDALAEALKPALDALGALGDLFSRPTNVPHDPALLRDRRKWGGR